MKTFRTSTYSIPCAGLTGHRKVTFAVLADLHGLVFGQNHQTLYKAIIDANPDAILVAGDMVVHKSPETLEAAAGLFLRLCEMNFREATLFFTDLNFRSNIITSPIPLRSVLPLWKSSSVCLRSRESTYCLHTIPNTAIRIFHGVPI